MQNMNIIKTHTVCYFKCTMWYNGWIHCQGLWEYKWWLQDWLKQEVYLYVKLNTYCTSGQQTVVIIKSCPFLSTEFVRYIHHQRSRL